MIILDYLGRPQTCVWAAIINYTHQSEWPKRTCVLCMKISRFFLLDIVKWKKTLVSSRCFPSMKNYSIFFNCHFSTFPYTVMCPFPIITDNIQSINWQICLRLQKKTLYAHKSINKWYGNSCKILLRWWNAKCDFNLVGDR